jgi:hypothetical protein
MTPDEIVAKASELKVEATNIAPISMSNYQFELAEYKQILNDVLVLIRELGKAVVTLMPPQQKE